LKTRQCSFDPSMKDLPRSKFVFFLLLPLQLASSPCKKKETKTKVVCLMKKNEFESFFLAPQNFSIGDCGNGRTRRNQPPVGIYVCVYVVNAHTERPQNASVYSSKSARTAHVSFSQILSTERNGLQALALSQLFLIFLHHQSVCVCVCVCVCVSGSIYLQSRRVYTALPSSEEFIINFQTENSFSAFSPGFPIVVNNKKVRQ